MQYGMDFFLNREINSLSDESIPIEASTTRTAISVLLRIAHAQSQPFHNQREQFIGRVYEVNYYDSTVVLYLDDCNFANRKINGRAVAYLPRMQLAPKTDIGTVVSFGILHRTDFQPRILHSAGE